MEGCLLRPFCDMVLVALGWDVCWPQSTSRSSAGVMQRVTLMHIAHPLPYSHAGEGGSRNGLLRETWVTVVRHVRLARGVGRDRKDAWHEPLLETSGQGVGVGEVLSDVGVPAIPQHAQRSLRNMRNLVEFVRQCNCAREEV